MGKLTTKKVSSLKDAGMYGDGDGLYLRIGEYGGKSWILRTVVQGKRRDLGIGSVKTVGLAEARDEAREMRKIARKGGDPIEERKRVSLTFEEAARRVHSELRKSWRSEDHAVRWISSLDRYVFPEFGSKPIHQLDSSHVLNVLSPIWTEKNETASKVKQRIATVFDWAKSAMLYPNENPVNGVTRALPTVKHRPQHMAALPWSETPAFMSELKKREGTSARCLEFIILTAARSGEARGARWSEISGGVWTVPAERMKTGEKHRVPLSPAALATLEKVKGLDDELVFPSPSRGPNGNRPLSGTVFAALYKRMKLKGLTTHGFRSTFRDWCRENQIADREIAEIALSHKVGDAVERAYARSDLFLLRLQLMTRWADHATGKNISKATNYA